MEKNLNNVTEEELNKMSDEDIDKLYQYTQTEEGRKMNELPSNNSILKQPSVDYINSINDSKKEYENKTVDMELKINPATGLGDLTSPANHFKQNDEMNLDMLLDKDIDEIDIEAVRDSTASLGANDLSDREVSELLEFIKTVSKSKPVSVYSILPGFLKSIIDTNIPTSNKKQKEEMAIGFYNIIKDEISTNNSFIELDKLITKTTEDMPNMIDMYLDHIRNIMENELPRELEAILEDKERAKKLSGMIESFKDSYKYTSIRSKIENKRKIINKELTKDLKNYDKFCNKFNAAYLSSKMVIPNIKGILYILDRKLPDDINIDSIKKFIILLCKLCRKKDNKDIVDHTYMYYSLRLIESLDHIEAPKSSMYDTIINNICATIYLLEGDMDKFNEYDSIIIEPTRIDKQFEDLDLDIEDLDDIEIDEE